MFTNWLTSSSTTSSTSAATESGIISSTPIGGVVPAFQSPDVLIEVGPPPFSRYAAHSQLLIAHSGYLRAALHPDGAPSEHSIFLPNITAEQFSPLLTYMYTGFLDLNIENIFVVLLATHILHMPRALEICRAFLTRTQNEEYLMEREFAPPISQSSCVIRPIPSKPITEHGISFISPPISHNILLPSRDTKFKKITANNNRERSPIPSTSQIMTTPFKSKSTSVKRIKFTITPPLTTQQKQQQQQQSVTLPSPTPTPSAIKTTKPPILMPTTSKSEITHPSHHNASSPTPSSTSSSSSSSTTTTKPSSPSSATNKTIIDVACCDGPVRFHRVLNDTYGRNQTVTSPPNETQQRHNHYNLTSSFHQQMAKHISERNNLSEESENSQDTHHPKDICGATSTAATTGGSSEFYICVYCKHTFKSQYCYQKHAKRHINPLTIDGSACGGGGGGSSNGDESIIEIGDEKSAKSEAQPVPPMPPIKREVRPLDMNVQYYPCKTCGCKFPSYYFVHKHRKMCHADEENP